MLSVAQPPTVKKPRVKKPFKPLPLCATDKADCEKSGLILPHCVKPISTPMAIDWF